MIVPSIIHLVYRVKIYSLFLFLVFVLFYFVTSFVIFIRRFNFLYDFIIFLTLLCIFFNRSKSFRYLFRRFFSAIFLLRFRFLLIITCVDFFYSRFLDSTQIFFFDQMFVFFAMLFILFYSTRFPCHFFSDFFTISQNALSVILLSL